MALLETAGGIFLFAFAAIVPGYFLSLAFFPSKKEIDLAERLAFSVLFSISSISILVLLENQLAGIPVDFFSVAATILLLAAVGFAVFMVRAQRVQAPAFVYALFPKIGRNDAAEIIPKSKNS